MVRIIPGHQFFDMLLPCRNNLITPPEFWLTCSPTIATSTPIDEIAGSAPGDEMTH
jgi:hypothetical protein